MTPAEYEWQCELAETEIKGLMREHPDRVTQARERPQLIDWFVGQAAKNLGGCDDRDMLDRLATDLIMMTDRV